MAKLPRNLRRRAMRLGYYNGALWAAGNGLTSGTLIYYLAMELGADKMAVGLGLILAAPALASLLRLVAPLVIRAAGGAKRTCLAASAAGYLLLGLLAPLAAVESGSRPGMLALLVGVLCVHQLLESIGAVALWAWLAAIVPEPLRGRYFAGRQFWQLAVLIPTLLASGWFVDYWQQNVRYAFPPFAMADDWPLAGYLLPILLGAVLLLASLWPLARMPDVPGAGSDRRQPAWSELRAPLANRSFRRLLLFGCWFSFFNGLTGAAQGIYPYAVLGLGVFWLTVMRTTMRLGQMAGSPLVGRLSDRWGNLPVLAVCLVLTAAGPAFFLAANPQRWWLLFGAWIVWSAYVGLNVCLPNLMLKISPARSNAPYIAMYFGITSVCYAVSSTLGGYVFHWLPADALIRLGPWNLDRFDYLFAFGWITRTLGLLFLLRVIEPRQQTV